MPTLQQQAGDTGAESLALAAVPSQPLAAAAPGTEPPQAGSSPPGPSWQQGPPAGATQSQQQQQQQQQSSLQGGESGRPQQQQQSSGSGQPNQQNVVMKERLRWTPELHASFVKAVNQLGGAAKAKPKEILDILRIPGLSLNHVKSHLQKYRLSEGMPGMGDATSVLAMAQQLQSLEGILGQKRPREDSFGQGWGASLDLRGGPGPWPPLAGGSFGGGGSIASLGLPQLPPQPALAIPPLSAGPDAAALASAAVGAAQPPKRGYAGGSGTAVAGLQGWQQPGAGAGLAGPGGLDGALTMLGSSAGQPLGALVGGPGAASAAPAAAASDSPQAHLLQFLSEVVKQGGLGGGAQWQGLPGVGAAGGGVAAAGGVGAANGGVGAANGGVHGGLAQLQQGVAVLHHAVVQHLESAAALQLDLQKKLQWHIQIQREFEQQLVSHIEAIRYLAINSLGPLLLQLTSLSELCERVAGSAAAGRAAGAAEPLQQHKAGGGASATGEGTGRDGAAHNEEAGAMAEPKAQRGADPQEGQQQEEQQQVGGEIEGRGVAAATGGRFGGRGDWSRADEALPGGVAEGKEQAPPPPLPPATRAAIDAVVALATAASAGGGRNSLSSVPGSFGSQVPSRHSSGGFLPPGQQPTLPGCSLQLGWQPPPQQQQQQQVQQAQRPSPVGAAFGQTGGSGRGLSLGSLGMEAPGCLPPSFLTSLDNSSVGTTLLGPLGVRQGMHSMGPSGRPFQQPALGRHGW